MQGLIVNNKDNHGWRDKFNISYLGEDMENTT